MIILSDAAPGAAQGALEAAVQLGLEHGGWSPNNVDVPAIFRTPGRHYTTADNHKMAARLNVQDSDATLLVSFAEDMSGRVEHLAEQARQQRKTCKQLVLPAGGRSRVPDAVRTALRAWFREAKIERLHVTGPREEREPGLQVAVRDALVWLIEAEPEAAPASDVAAVVAAEVAAIVPPVAEPEPPLTVVSFDDMMRDYYPRAGERIKQWVVDERKRAAWERETCPRVEIAEHDDNTGMCCRNSGGAQWTDLDHDSCYTCGDLHQAARDRTDVVAWRADLAKQPPICEDRERLSDEIEPNRALATNPVFAFLRRPR